jgi:diguanylate cyclase (GGDEF)-like protein
MRRAWSRALQGAALAVGAPLGWLLIEWLGGTEPLASLRGQPVLYAYMLVATLLVFGLVGRILGEREDRLRAAKVELEELTVTDALTGLRNGRYFFARLADEDAERARTGQPLAVAVLDLDRFKRVNDVHGHLAGNDVLANAGRAIAAVTRVNETAARVGGEEFALLLPGSTGAAARDVAERVRRAIGGAVTRLEDGQVLRVTASAGVASTADMPAATSHDLYRAADAALYRAKEAGRDRTVLAIDMVG